MACALAPFTNVITQLPPAKGSRRKELDALIKFLLHSFIMLIQSKKKRSKQNTTQKWSEQRKKFNLELYIATIMGAYFTPAAAAFLPQKKKYLRIAKEKGVITKGEWTRKGCWSGLLPVVTLFTFKPQIIDVIAHD